MPDSAFIISGVAEEGWNRHLVECSAIAGSEYFVYIGVVPPPNNTVDGRNLARPGMYETL